MQKVYTCLPIYTVTDIKLNLGAIVEYDKRKMNIVQTLSENQSNRLGEENVLESATFASQCSVNLTRGVEFKDSMSSVCAVCDSDCIYMQRIVGLRQ